jgi:hypothetical protein
MATLAKMRCMGGGPVYHKLGRRVGYRRCDLIQWLNERRVRNTTEAAHSLPRRLTDVLRSSCSKPASVAEVQSLPCGGDDNAR